MKEIEETLAEKLVQSNEQLENKNIQADPKIQKVSESYFSKTRYLFGNNFFQTVFFTWISPLLTYGYRITVDQKAIPHLRDGDKPKVDFTKLSQKLEKNLRDNRSKREGVTLLKSILATFWYQFLLVGIFSLMITSGSMYGPILSHSVIEYIDSGDKEFTTALRYFLTIFAINLFTTIAQTFLFYYFGVLGFNLSNTLSLLVFNKALKHPLVTEKQFAIADIINYSQVDAQRMTSLGWNLVSLLYAPILIIFALVILYFYIGISFLAGVGIMILLMLCTLIFTKIATTGNDQLLKAKDARMKAAQQIIEIIKFIKINALEKFFFQKTNRKRQNQLRYIKKVNLCYVASIFLYWLCPPVIVSLTFVVFISLGNQISASQAFLTIIIFNILQFPIRMLPSAISEVLQIWASVKRLQKFLKASQIKSEFIQQNNFTGQKYAIQIQRGYYLWGKQKDEKKDEENKQKEKEQKQKEKQKEKQSSRTRLKRKKQKKSPPKNSNKKGSQSLNDAISQSFDSLSQVNSQQKFKQSMLSDKDKQSILLSINSENGDGQKKYQKFIKVLQGINIKFPSGETTMIIGDIGSGKSSLLYAILNQMTPEPDKNSKITINGTIAYSSQKAWIMSGTVKDNITFFQPYDEKRFNQAIHYASLQDDIKILNKGIMTEIGEKGVNLSGGQKARISLARALYSNKDIYLLDDILSAVDVHVGNFIMQKTILEYLKGKTVIMPTHAIKYLQRSDNIIIMKKGKVIASGPYNHINDCQQFQEILKLEEQKMHEKLSTKPSKQQEGIVNELKLIKQGTKSKQVQQGYQVKNSQTQYTDKIVDQLIMPEDHHKGSVSYKVYLQYIKLNGGVFFAVSVILCMSIWTTLSILSNIQVQRWCEDQNKSKKYLYFYLVLGISATFFSGLRAFILVTSGINQGRIIHKKMIKSLLYASITRFYNRVPVGRILNRLSKDLREVDEALGYVVGNVLVCVFSTIGGLVMCIYASTPLIIIPIIITSFLFNILLKYYLKSQRQCVRMQKITSSPIVSGFTSVVNGVATVRAYGLQSQFLNNQIERIDVNKRMRMTREAMQSWLSLRLALVSFLINISALAYSIFSNNQNASLIGLLLTYTSKINDDIIGLAFGYSNMELRMISIERVDTFTKLQPQTGYVQYCQNWRTKQQGANQNAIPYGKIQFQNYSARYREGLPLVIKNLNLKINQGKKVGIVGRTGAGKSTLFNCILRIIQAAQGSIRIDGVTLPNYRLKDLRACMTMIQQQPTLINGSFRQNLDPTNKYTEEQINNTIKSCNLAQLVQTKGGLDAKITNSSLSVGERQLICICRAFLKKSKIILIDQATANIDVKNDKLIQEVIATAFKDSTVLTIAHRLSTIKNCDQIVVLGEGKIIQTGETSQLLKKQGGIYRKMCQQNDNSYLL